MHPIKHFIVTRIGLGIYSEPRLNKVIDLFEAVTLASLANQSSQAFSSLIVVDAHMPAGARTKISTLLANRSKFFLVPIDVTRLIHVRAGCFDWIWEHCQDFILKNGLIDHPQDYIVSSILDADDAWHRDVVASINAVFSERLPRLLVREKGGDRSTWTSHTAGMIATFPHGYQWYIPANAIAKMTYPFHSMSVFVASRFSGGISACSSRHSQWPEYSKVVQFEVGVSNIAAPMWVYGRHDEATVGWSAHEGVPIGAFETELSATFGVDAQKIREWRSAYAGSPLSEYLGQRTTREQYDLIFRIAALNRKIRAMRMGANLQTVAITRDDELMPCEIERENLIEKLQG
jgi:hypothetical protein